MLVEGTDRTAWRLDIVASQGSLRLKGASASAKGLPVILWPMEVLR